MRIMEFLREFKPLRDGGAPVQMLLTTNEIVDELLWVCARWDVSLTVGLHIYILMLTSMTIRFTILKEIFTAQNQDQWAAAHFLEEVCGILRMNLVVICIFYWFHFVCNDRMCVTSYHLSSISMSQVLTAAWSGWFFCTTQSSR